MILESNEGDSVIVVEYRGISEIYPVVYAIVSIPNYLILSIKIKIKLLNTP